MTVEEHRTNLIRLLEKDKRYWFDRKENVDAHNQPDYYQDMKAMYSIIGDAIMMIEKLDLSKAENEQEFKELVNEAIEADRREWGWGSNWSDCAQSTAVSRAINLIKEYLSKI